VPCDGQPWNVNIHYDGLLDSKVPLTARRFSTSGAVTDSARPGSICRSARQVGAGQRLAGPVNPGGTLAVVTFVKRSPRNALWHLTSWTAGGVANRIRGKWGHTAPIKWPPADTLLQLRGHVRALPGAQVRRLLYGLALISWRAPG